jgi:hypothetical protein
MLPLAYLDPGAGSQMLQFLLAGLLAGLFALKMFWQNVRGFFSSRFSRNRNPSDDGS